MTRFCSWATLRKYINQAKAGGLKVEKTSETLIIYDGKIKVLQALKHPAGHWITTLKNTDNVTWI